MVLETRPPGRPTVLGAAHKAGIPPADITDLGDLPELGEEELQQLLREELGEEMGYLADSLARLTPDSPLVALVAAGLLRDRDEEFWYLV
jgi:hypothetical protein